ncbi:MAG: phage/plasmid primase, P4 family [Candidatus Micrarchaeota archaeon]
MSPEQEQQKLVVRPNDLGYYFTKKQKFIPKKLGDDILQFLKIKTVRDSEEVFVYENGVYKKMGVSYIKELANAWLENTVRTNMVNEVVAYVQRATYVKEEEQNKNLVNLKNGLFDIEKNVLLQHSPDYFFISQLPLNYNQTADCPKIKKFLSEVLGPDNITLIQELFGYCLYADYPIAKAAFFFGEESTGKSTLLNIFEAFLGKENVSAIALQELNHRFSKAELFGKLANIHADLPDDTVTMTDTFKMLTGNDLIKGEKKFKDPFYYHNHAKLLFSTNRLPEVKNARGDYFKRILLIEFPNKFEGEKAKTGLIKEITVPEELSGLFNWALEGLQRLLQQGHFSGEKTTDEIKENYYAILKTQGSGIPEPSISTFIADRIELAEGSLLTKEETYRTYVDFCSKKGLPKESLNLFCRRLKKSGFGDKYPKIGEKQKWCWIDVRLKSEQKDNKLGFWE